VILDQSDRGLILLRAEEKLAHEADMLLQDDRDARRWDIASGVVNPDSCIVTFNG
jgi:hypothetical protein